MHVYPSNKKALCVENIFYPNKKNCINNYTIAKYFY